MTDKPEWSSTIEGRRTDFYGFISGTANLTCDVIAEPPPNFSWYRVISPSVASQRRTSAPKEIEQENVKYEEITKDSYPSAQIINAGGKSTLMVKSILFVVFEIISRFFPPPCLHQMCNCFHSFLHSFP